MSEDHVRNLLLKRPELIGILGREAIASYVHGSYQRIDAALLKRFAWEGERYLLISEDRTLLREVPWRQRKATAEDSAISYFTRLKARVLNVFASSSSHSSVELVYDALRKVGPKNVAYIVEISEGSEGYGHGYFPCEIIIHDLPKDRTMDDLVRSFPEEFIGTLMDSIAQVNKYTPNALERYRKRIG